MSIDTENMTYESCNDDIFYDAFEMSCLDTHKTSQEQFSESDPNGLDNLDSSVTGLNETYSLPNEAPILLCNQLPFLDNAIKSIKIQSNDGEIKFASVHLTSAPNAESPKCYTSTKLNKPLKGCYEGLKEGQSSSKDHGFEIKSNKRQSDCCPVNVDGDHLKSACDTITNLPLVSEKAGISHSNDRLDCKADMETFGEGAKSLVDTLPDSRDKMVIEQRVNCFISHNFTEVEFGTLEEKEEELSPIDSNDFNLDTSKCVLNKSYEEFESIEIDSSSVFGGYDILSSSREKLMLEPESVQEEQTMANGCESGANSVNLSDVKEVSEQIKSTVKSNALREVDSLTDSVEANSADTSICTAVDITVESQEEFLSIDMDSSTFEDQIDLDKTSNKSKENDNVTSEFEIPQDILEEIREKRKPNPPKRILTPEEDTRRNKFPRMTKQILQKVCKEQKLYQTPYLNEILYLHYRGFGWIENLEDYTGLRCLFLDVNGIDKIEGLEYQTEMRCLFLSKNLIKRIENLDHMIHLDTLDISHNMISKIENLATLPVLTKLIISHNKLEALEDIEHLRECKSLTIIDLQQNHISTPEALEKVFAQMPSLRVLYNQGNPFIKDVKYYRKNFINQCKELTYLDDRPVFPKDRACAEAFYRGGADEENRVRKELNDAEQKRIRDSCNWLSERRKKIEAANREKELAEKGMPNVHINLDEADWLYNEKQSENLDEGAVESNDPPKSNEASSVGEVRENGILQNADGDCKVQISNGRDANTEEVTCSKNIPENLAKQKENGGLAFSVTIDSDSSDESTIEVLGPNDRKEEIAEEPNSRNGDSNNEGKENME
ncbi:unnamed protein product [Rodentolepis nana]|uniref:Dynein axonemal assembly factor 1 homolog n=1 Tax=Rodentolepis nana TaxID=102285 RepID=A0A0R3TMK8_RODNA|nr:unnamed protein product [Rodentolepis nana]